MSFACSDTDRLSVLAVKILISYQFRTRKLENIKISDAVIGVLVIARIYHRRSPIFRTQFGPVFFF